MGLRTDYCSAWTMCSTLPLLRTSLAFALAYFFSQMKRLPTIPGLTGPKQSAGGCRALPFDVFTEPWYVSRSREARRLKFLLCYTISHPGEPVCKMQKATDGLNWLTCSVNGCAYVDERETYDLNPGPNQSVHRGTNGSRFVNTSYTQNDCPKQEFLGIVRTIQTQQKRATNYH